MNPNPSDREQYTSRLLELYRQTPGTLGRVRRDDRRLAVELFDRGLPLQVVEDALILATARRCLRPSDAAPLSSVRSLHYFVPVIEEVLATPLTDGYADYLRWKLRSIQAAHDSALDGAPKRIKPS